MAFQNPSYKRSHTSCQEPNVSAEEKGFPSQSRIVHYQRESSKGSSQGGNNLDAPQYFNQMHSSQNEFHQPSSRHEIQTKQEQEMSSSSPQKEMKGQLLQNNKETNENTLSSPTYKNQVIMDDQFNPISLVNALGNPESERVFSPLARTSSNGCIIRSQRGNLPPAHDFIIRQSQEVPVTGGTCRTQNYPEQEEEFEYQESENEELIQYVDHRLQAREVVSDSIETSGIAESYPSSNIVASNFQIFSQQFSKREKNKSKYNDPQESLSRPAIISLSSNQKKVQNSRQNGLNYSPGGNSSHYHHMASKSSFQGEQEYQVTRKLGESNSQGSQFNKNTQLALSQTHPESHLQVYQEYSGEMEGLDLTDENIEANGEYEDLEHHILLSQKDQEAELYRINHLSSIHNSQDNTIVSSQTKQILRQQQDLDLVEANLESEVEQLNQIYAQYRSQNAKIYTEESKPNAYLLQRQLEYQGYRPQNGHMNSDSEIQRSSQDEFQGEENDAEWSPEKSDANQEYDEEIQNEQNENRLHLSGSMELKQQQNHNDQSQIDESYNQEGLIQEMADYVLICEQRILELVPNHILPITHEHLGQPNPQQSQTENLFMQISRYQEQIGFMARGHKSELDQQQQLLESLTVKYDRLKALKPPMPIPAKKQPDSEQLIQQNQALQIQVTQLKQENLKIQQILRNETQLNEEQKYKIAILKESVEQKLDPSIKQIMAQSRSNTIQTKSINSHRDSISQISMTNIEPSHSRGDSNIVDQYVSLKQLKNENENLKKKLNENIDSSQMTSKIDQLHKNLELKAQDINFYKQELVKLQQELMTSHDQNRHLLTEINSISSKLSQQNNITQELVDFSDRNIELQAQVDILSNKLRDNQSIGESMKNEINESQMRVSQFKDRVKGENTDKVQMMKQVDELEMVCSALQEEKNRLEEDGQMREKRSNAEIESLKKIIAQNKQYTMKQEERIREINDQYQNEENDQKQKNEKKNLDQLKQITSLKSKVSDLEQKCFTINFEKTQLDEAAIESTSNQYSFELESLKNKQLSEKVKQQQTQLTNSNSRINILENKIPAQNHTIENLKQQNEWLKDERSKIQKEILHIKSEIEQERKQNQQISHKLSLVESQNKDLKEQLQTELDRTNQDSEQIISKHKQSETKLASLIQENESLTSNQAQLDKRLIGVSSDLAAFRRDKALLENQLQDLSQENEQLYRNEERTKRLISEVEELKSANTILKKEVSYSDTKRQNIQDQLQSIENELRVTIRQKNEIEEKLTNVKVQKESQDESLEKYSQDNTKFIKEIELLKTEVSKTQLDKKVLNQRIEDLSQKLNKTEKLKEDMQMQISRNIQKSNDYCLKFEKENKVLEGVKLIQNNTNKALVNPFLNQMIQQVEASDILKECLYARPDDALEYFIRITEPFLNVDTDSQSRDVLQIERTISFEYIKFLHQDIIEKLTQSLLEQKSENILLNTKNKSLNKRLVSIESQEYQTAQYYDNQNLEINRYEILLQELQQEEKRLLNQNAGLRQKIKNLESQNSELFALNREKENQMLSMNHEQDQLSQNKSMLSKQHQELNDYHVCLEREHLEKKYMWRALKSLKQFLKTDECFEPLLVMLNEYIILLEQLVFEKKQDSKKLGFNTNKLFESTQKLKMVEQDMKCFKLPISINNCLPQKQVFSGEMTQATGYATARVKGFGKTFVDVGMSNTTMFDTHQQQFKNINNNYFSAQSTTMLGKQLENLME